MNKKLIALIVMIISFILLVNLCIFGYYCPVSNADVKKDSIDAKLTCKQDGIKITWEYDNLNASESLKAMEYAEQYNCTFEHFKLTKFIEEDK